MAETVGTLDLPTTTTPVCPVAAEEKSDETDKTGDKDQREDSMVPKRPHPVAEPTDKVSPEKKVTKTAEGQVPVQPKALDFEDVNKSLTLQKAMPLIPEKPASKAHGESLGGSDQGSKTVPAFSEDVVDRGSVAPQSVAPEIVPATVAATGQTGSMVAAESAEQALLRRALEKIEQLESRLSQSSSQNLEAPLATPQDKVRKPLTPSQTTPKTTTTCTPTVEEDDEEEEAEEPSSTNLLVFPNGTKAMSHDALRMRLRRLCETKAKSQKCYVDTETAAQYARGGEDREWLEIALIEALQKVGPENKCHKKVRVSWQHLKAYTKSIKLHTSEWTIDFDY